MGQTSAAPTLCPHPPLLLKGSTSPGLPTARLTGAGRRLRPARRVGRLVRAWFEAEGGPCAHNSRTLTHFAPELTLAGLVQSFKSRLNAAKLQQDDDGTRRTKGGSCDLYAAVR